MSDFLRDWDNRRKYEKTPWHRNVATIGHLGYLHQIMSDSLNCPPTESTSSTGNIDCSCSKNVFKYKGTSDGAYQLPDPAIHSTNGVFVINKSNYLLTVEGQIWDFVATTQREVQSGEVAYFISDGEHWTIYN